MTKIPMSPNHGLNPAIPVCFYCQEPKNEVALLGYIGDKKLGEDIEAPKHVLLDYEPCDKCKEKMAGGIALIEVQGEPVVDGLPPVKEGLYPTGRCGVITREYAEAMFNVPVNERAFVDVEVYEAVFSPKEGGDE